MTKWLNIMACQFLLLQTGDRSLPLNDGLFFIISGQLKHVFQLRFTFKPTAKRNVRIRLSRVIFGTTAIMHKTTGFLARLVRIRSQQREER
jgi:hypothetical protein